MIKNISRKNLITSTFAWITTWIIFFLMIRFNNNNGKPFESATIEWIIAISVSLMHFYLFDLFFKSRRYIRYILSVIAFLFVFSLVIEQLLINVTYLENNSFTYFIFASTTYLFLSLGIYFYLNGLSGQYYNADLKLENTNYQIKLLKNQIQPHYLFNNLNNIYAKSLSNPQEASVILCHLEATLSYFFKISTDELIKISDEIEFITSYIKLDSMRNSNTTKIQFEFEGENEGEIPRGILIPLIENAFKYGSNAKINSTIEIKIVASEDFFEMFVTNDIVNKATQENTKTGLNSLKKRLVILFPQNHKLIIKNDYNKFKVELRIPIKQQYEKINRSS